MRETLSPSRVAGRPPLRALLSPVVLGLALAACASATRARDVAAPAVDVSTYRTYAWATAAPVIDADEERARDAAVLEITIREAVDRALAAKGYRPAAGASPDFLVDFGVRLEEKSADTFGEYIAYRDRGGQQNLGGAFVFGYEEGTVVVEVTDARSRKPAWSGARTVVLDDGQDIAKLEGAVGEILAGFPVAGAGDDGDTDGDTATASSGGDGSDTSATPKSKLVDLDRYIYVPQP
ncbi:MAG TPA: DUF4136 domain-containing protein [Candidatus Binatia bacterium]